MNTFQLAVASDGESSYAIFLYPEVGLAKTGRFLRDNSYKSESK